MILRREATRKYSRKPNRCDKKEFLEAVRRCNETVFLEAVSYKFDQLTMRRKAFAVVLSLDRKIGNMSLIISVKNGKY